MFLFTTVNSVCLGEHMNTIEAPDWKIRLDQRKDRERLCWHMDQMNKAAQTVAKSLQEIQRDKLYRHDFSSFEEFCEKALGMKRGRAYQILNAQGVKDVLTLEGGEEMCTAVNNLSDKAALALEGIPAPIALEAVKTAAARGKVTEKALREITGRPRKPKLCPHCQGEIG